jgi:predicted DsbA family dithiol-disulfide isomerase
MNIIVTQNWLGLQNIHFTLGHSMKKLLLFVTILLIPAQLFAQTTEPASGDMVDWSVLTTWKLDTVPLDLVHSLDQKKVFILGFDHNVHIYNADGLKLGVIPVNKGVTAIDIAPRGERLFLINGEENSFTAINVSFPVKIDISKAPYLGPENAPVTLTVFSDFQCPFCSKVQPELEKLLENNPTNLKITFMHMPLNMHEYAQPAAHAAIAAQNQGKFWQMHDALFAIEELNLQKIDEAAKSIELDMNRFQKDMNSPQTHQRLLEDMRAASKADVTGTPTLFINGRRVMQRDPGSIQTMIDRELKIISAGQVQ